MSEPYAGSVSSWGSEFQNVGPAIENARRPYVLRRQRGTMSWWRFAERRRSRGATSEDAMKWSALGGEVPRCLTMKTAVHGVLYTAVCVWDLWVSGWSVRMLYTVVTTTSSSTALCCRATRVRPVELTVGPEIGDRPSRAPAHVAVVESVTYTYTMLFTSSPSCVF